MDKHIVAVTALVMHPDGKRFLILKRSKHEIAYPSKWCFPGGKVEKGQTATQALEREVKEEAGLSIKDIEFLVDFTFVRPDGHNVVGINFKANAIGDAVEIDTNDFDEWEWVTADQFRRYDCIEGMENAVQKAFRKASR